MAKIEIEFHWTKAQRFVFRTPGKPRPKLGGEERLARFRNTGVWPAAAPTNLEEFDSGAIVAQGAAMPVTLQSRQPLYVTLLRLYEKHKLSPNRLRDTALDFAGTYGLLNVPSAAGVSETLSQWEEAISTAKKLHKWDGGFRNSRDPFGTLKAKALRFGNFELHLVPDPLNRRPILKIVPKTLFGLMQLQWAMFRASGAQIKNCVHCGQLFAAGGDSDRREDATYCDETCKERAKNARKKDGAGSKTRRRRR